MDASDHNDDIDEECDLDEPLDPIRAKKLIRQIVMSGTVGLSKHAEDEMRKDDLSMVDCVNVLRGGVVEQPELERNSWRYRVRTNRIVVVVAFRSAKAISVVTAWRIQ